MDNNLNTGNSERGERAKHPVYVGSGRAPERTDEPRRPQELRTTAAVVAGGSLLESIGGGGAVVLAILGLAGVLPLWMAAIGTIAVGGALIAQGAAIASRWDDLLERIGGERTTRAELGGGMGAETLGGAAAVVLAVIALAGTLPVELLSIAAIVLGGALLLGSPTQTEVAQVDVGASPVVRRATRSAADASTGLLALAGIGSAVLGVLALIMRGDAMTLSLVAILVVGGALLLSGGAVTARFAPRLR
jgi:hypothetical protein